MPGVLVCYVYGRRDDTPRGLVSVAFCSGHMEWMNLPGLQYDDGEPGGVLAMVLLGTSTGVAINLP